MSITIELIRDPTTATTRCAYVTRDTDGMITRIDWVPPTGLDHWAVGTTGMPIPPTPPGVVGRVDFADRAPIPVYGAYSVEEGVLVCFCTPEAATAERREAGGCPMSTTPDESLLVAAQAAAESIELQATGTVVVTVLVEGADGPFIAARCATRGFDHTSILTPDLFVVPDDGVAS